MIVRPLQELGINPWIAHFFVFLMSVWGELSPPTSLTAAVSARIANASFLRTMWEALKICLPITLMTFAIFTRPNMVVNPGWLQIADTMLVLICTCGITFAMFGRYLDQKAADIALRCLLAAVSLFCMFHPDMTTSAMAAVLVVPAFAVGVWRHRHIAAPKIGRPARRRAGRAVSRFVEARGRGTPGYRLARSAENTAFSRLNLSGARASNSCSEASAVPPQPASLS